MRVAGVSEEPVVDAGGERQAAQEHTQPHGIRSRGDGLGGEALPGQFVEEVDGLLVPAGLSQEPCLVIAHEHDDPPAGAGRVGLQRP